MKLMEDDLGRGSGQGGRQLSLEMLRHERRTRTLDLLRITRRLVVSFRAFPTSGDHLRERRREGGRERERERGF